MLESDFWYRIQQSKGKLVQEPLNATVHCLRFSCCPFHKTSRLTKSQPAINQKTSGTPHPLKYSQISAPSAVRPIISLAFFNKQTSKELQETMVSKRFSK